VGCCVCGLDGGVGGNVYCTVEHTQQPHTHTFGNPIYTYEICTHIYIHVHLRDMQAY